MNIHEHDAMMAKKVASEMSPFELRMKKKRRLRNFYYGQNLSLMAGIDIDRSDDDLYQKFINCEINIDELREMVLSRLKSEYSLKQTGSFA